MAVLTTTIALIIGLQWNIVGLITHRIFDGILWNILGILREYDGRIMEYEGTTNGKNIQITRYVPSLQYISCPV